MKFKVAKKISSILLIVMLLSCMSAALLKEVFSADNEEIILESNLEKYVNYKLSEEKQGTLVQYNVKARIKYQERYTPIKNTEVTINLSKIDGLFPEDVKVLAKSTKVTNGKEEGALADYSYSKETGVLTIKANNQNEEGKLIKEEQPSNEDRDEYVVICNYNTYSTEKEERNVSIHVSSKVMLLENNREITAVQYFENKVTEDVGTLISVISNIDEIYNGKIKSNVVNGTQYGTQYKEYNQIMISKQDAQDRIQYVENNNEEDKIKFNSTTISKKDVVNMLGEEGTLEILDKDNNVLTTINKDTEYDENGKFTYTYEKEINSIKIKTSDIKQEGTLNIEHTKEIKSDMLDLNKNKFGTMIEVAGLDVTKENVVDENTKETVEQEKENISFGIRGNKEAEIKNTQTKVNVELNQIEWTNEKQNEVEFTVSLDSSKIQYDLFKNPTIKIQLPNQVEKVVLGESQLLYANGLAIKNAETVKENNGTISIIATLEGNQTSYDESNLGLVTTLKIPARVILNKDIESTSNIVNVLYTNEYSKEHGNIEKNIKLIDFTTKEAEENGEKQQEQENKEQSIVEKVENIAEEVTEHVDAQKAEGISLSISADKGDHKLNDRDIVYAGEFIKYSISVKNTTNKDINNVKVVGEIPDGTKYAELESQFGYINTAEKRKYQYNFDENLTKKEIDIGRLNPGQTITKYYEVQVKDTDIEEKEITNNIKAYIDNQEVATKPINHVIKRAEAKVFLYSEVVSSDGECAYGMNLQVPKGQTANITLTLPEQIAIDPSTITQKDENGQEQYIGQTFIHHIGDSYSTSRVEDNIGVQPTETTEREKEEFELWYEKYKATYNGNILNITVSESGTYRFELKITDDNKLREAAADGPVELNAYTTMKVGDISYKSNQNRTTFEYPAAEIKMTSPNEGEEVKYGEEINYDIQIKATGVSNYHDEVGEINGIQVNVLDYLPEYVEPINVTYDYYEIEYEQLEGGAQKVKGFKPKQEKTETLYKSQDTDNNDLPEVDLILWVPYEETISVKVKTTAGFVTDKTEISNSAIIQADPKDSDEKNLVAAGIKTKTSNVIKHTIVPKDEVIDPIPDPKPDPEPDPNPEPEPDPDPTPDPEPNDKYSVSGIAWNDENQDGKRQENEPILSGISVLLVNLNEPNNIVGRTSTSNGGYIFSDLAVGNYIVVFQYDTEHYQITDYQKAEVPENENSDATKQQIMLLGNKVEVGVTDTIQLNNNKNNIDIGLYEKAESMLAIDKYVNRVSVTTKKGTKQYDYKNSKLAKVDIRAKEIEGAIVDIDYKIVLTNTGKVPKNVGEIVDNIPSGLDFPKAQNKNWTVENGKVVNKSLANQQIAPGETKEIHIVLTKKMKPEETGTFTNTVSIKEMDVNSQADVIISISTGLATYITIGIIGAIAILIIVLLIVKFKIKPSKIIKLGIVLFSIAVVGTTISGQAFGIDSRTRFDHQDWGYNNHNFDGGPGGIGGECQNHDLASAGWALGNCNHSNWYGWHHNQATQTDYGAKETTSAPISLQKRNNKINVKKIGNNYILGPFETTSNTTNNYTITVLDKSGNRIDGWAVCDANGIGVGPAVGNRTFYLSLSETLYARGVSLVRAEQSKWYSWRQWYRTMGRAYYVSDVHKIECPNYKWWQFRKGHQNVLTWRCEVSSGYQQGGNNTTAKVEWTDFNSTLDIEKIDADNSDVKLNIEGTITKSDGSWSQSFKTTNGKVHFDNLTPGQYIIKETINNNYGYEANVGTTLTVHIQSGASYTVKLTNKKETGVLEMSKKDTSTNVALENIGFKVKDSKGNYVIAVDSAGREQKEVRGQIYLGNMKTTSNKNAGTMFLTDKTGKCTVYNIRTGTYVVEESFIGDNNFGYDLDGNYVSWESSSGSGKGLAATVQVTRQRSYNTSEHTNIIKDSQKTMDDGIYEIEAGVSSAYALDVTNAYTHNGANVAIYSKNQSIAQRFYLKYVGNGFYKIFYLGSDKCVETNGGPHLNANVGLYTDGGNNSQRWRPQDAGNGYYYLKSGTTNYAMDVVNGVAANNSNVRIWHFNSSNAQKFKFNTLSGISATGKAYTTVSFKNKRKYIKLSGYAWEDIASQKQSVRNDLWRDNANDQEDKRVGNVKVTLKDNKGNILASKMTKEGESAGNYIFGDYINDKNDVKIKIEDLDKLTIEFEYNGMAYKSVKVNTLADNGSKATDEALREAFNNSYSVIEKNQSLDESGKKKYDLKYDFNNHVSTLKYGDNVVYGYEGQNLPVSGVYDQYKIIANTKDADPNKILGQRITKDDIYNKGLTEIPNINLGLYERERPDLAVIEDIEKAKLILNGYEHTYKYDQRFSNPGQTGDGFNVAVKFGNKWGSASYTRDIYSSDIVYNKQDGNAEKLQAYITYKIAIRNESTNLYTTANELVNYYDSRYTINSIIDEKGQKLDYTEDKTYNKNGYKKISIKAKQQIEPQKQKYVYIEYKLQNDALNAVLNQDVTLNSVSEVSSYSTYEDKAFSKKYAGIDKDSNPEITEPTDRNTYEDDTDSAPSFILKVKEPRVIKGTVWEENAIDKLLQQEGYDKERKGDGKYDKSVENVVKNVKVELLKVEGTNSNGQKTYSVATLYKKDNKTATAETTTDVSGAYEFSGVIPGKYLVRYTYGNNSVIFDTKGKEKEKIEAENYKSTIYRGGDKNAAEAMTDYWYRAETGDKNTRLSDAKDEIGIQDDGTRFDIVEYRTTPKDEVNYGNAKEEEKLQEIEADTREFDIKIDYDVNLDNSSEYGADLKFIFDNVDLGVIKRPVQKIEARKEIAHIKVTLANGQVLIDGDPRKEKLEHLKFLPDGNVSIELDEELIQGARIDIKYDIIVDNKMAEIDYNNKDYYIYGTVPKGHEGWKIPIVKTLFDYLSNDLIFNEDSTINKDNWLDVEIKQELVDKGYLSKEAYAVLKKYNRIFKTDKFQGMKPGEEMRVQIEASKVLANTADDYNLQNDMEINTWKDTPPDDSIPGNYIPGNSLTNEPDNGDKTVTITQPTGENKNYLPYIILTISGLGLLVAGIVFIKKKLL